MPSGGAGSELAPQKALSSTDGRSTSSSSVVRILVSLESVDLAWSSSRRATMRRWRRSRRWKVTGRNDDDIDQIAGLCAASHIYF